MGASRPRDRAPTRLQQPAAWVDAALRVAAADTPGFAWLDGGDDGRSFLGLHADRELEGDDPALLDVVDRAWRRDRSRIWIGAITYDFAADLAAARAPRPRALPGLLLRRYACALERSRDGVVRVHGDDALPTWFAEVQPTDVAGPWPLTPPVAVWSPAHYRAQVLAAKQHLFAGDSYQVNLAQRFVAHWREPTAGSLATRVAALYGALRARAPAERGALLRLAAAWVVSNSPETLLDVDDDGVHPVVATSRPIKGTRVRESDPARDRAAAAALLASEKDRAEHVMIVDLVRNDLGRLAQVGSVVAAREPSALPLPTVHHLVTEVRATLRPDIGLRALVEAMVPGGSITGAPKRRTMAIIEALEQHPRGLYCGAIFVLAPDGLRMSIPIRTGVLDRQGLSLHAGGGIVIDSEPEAERRETWAKVRAFAPDAAP